MRTAIASAIIFLTPALTLAASPEKFYYLGEVKMSNAGGKPMGSQVILVEKIQDRDNSVILERAIVVQADGKTEEYLVRMAVKPDNTFSLTNESKSVEGTGTLAGPAWKWTYFKATFTTTNGVTIDDENFMADDSVITARKKVTAPNGQLIMYMDESVKAVSPATFEILRAGLMKK